MLAMSVRIGAAGDSVYDGDDGGGESFGRSEVTFLLDVAAFDEVCFCVVIVFMLGVCDLGDDDFDFDLCFLAFDFAVVTA